MKQVRPDWEGEGMSTVLLGLSLAVPSSDKRPYVHLNAGYIRVLYFLPSIWQHKLPQVVPLTHMSHIFCNMCVSTIRGELFITHLAFSNTRNRAIVCIYNSGMNSILNMETETRM